MAFLNLCQFIGNVGADPEIRTFEGGGKIATTRIAVTENYTDRNQQRQQRTEWVGLVFGSKLADIVEQYVKKGTPIYVQGKWHNREWTDQAGVKHIITEVQVNSFQLLSKPQQDQPKPQTAPTYQAPAPPNAPQYAPAPVPPKPQTAPPSFQPMGNGDLPF